MLRNVHHHHHRHIPVGFYGYVDGGDKKNHRQTVINSRTMMMSNDSGRRPLAASASPSSTKISNGSSHFTNAMAQLLSGKQVSDEIRAKLRDVVSRLSIRPVLAIIQVGGREDSNVYIRMKKNFAESVGADSRHVQLPRTATQPEVADAVRRLNDDPDVHGIIVQLPLDSVEPIDAHYVTNLISADKDVDGLTIANAGNLLHGNIKGDQGFIPCTPYGCLELIKKSGRKIEGAQAVVIGRSKIVGSPMAQLLIWSNATVTVCHSRTKDLPAVARTADILVVAIGKPLFVKKDWVKPGAVVIDCGISSIPDSSKKSGQRLVGDVDFDEVKEVASYITPVPGGVGPMTVAMLIANTVDSAKRRDPSYSELD